MLVNCYHLRSKKCVLYRLQSVTLSSTVGQYTKTTFIRHLACIRGYLVSVIRLPEAMARLLNLVHLSETLSLRVSFLLWFSWRRICFFESNRNVYTIFVFWIQRKWIVCAQMLVVINNLLWIMRKLWYLLIYLNDLKIACNERDLFLREQYHKSCVNLHLAHLN